jgi:probable F420-dependent oxidoreductase
MSVAGERAFRFGVSAFGAASGEEWREKAQRFEALGFDVLLMADHIAAPLLGWAPALMAAAAATTRLRVGTFVLDNNFRHPALVARDAATIDLLSGGRFELGIGGGWQPDNFARSGVPFGTPGERFGRLAESVRIIKGLLRAEPVTFDGSYYHLDELHGFPSPVQSPLPLLIGGGGPRLLDLAGREADIVAIAPPSLPEGGLQLAVEAEFFAGQVERLRAAAGARFATLELNVLLQRVTPSDDREAAAAELAAQWQKPGFALLASPHILMGTPDEMAADLRERRDRYGLSYITVFERDVEAFSPVMQLLRV